MISQIRILIPQMQSSCGRLNTRLRGYSAKRQPLSLQAMKATLGPTRNLHWVFKVADRTSTARFYSEVLRLTTLRHEEFEEGCAAACNGPYDNLWSKTMIGYGPEDDQFVLELTYNYTVKSYKLGNDYRHIAIDSKAAYAAASKHSTAAAVAGSSVPAVYVSAPGGYQFLVRDRDVPSGSTVMTQLSLSVTDLHKSLAFWQGFLGFELVTDQSSATQAVLSCGKGQATLRLVQLPEGQKLDRGTAYGRVAFATPGSQLQQLEKDVKEAGYTVHTPYVSLDTPGKATVQVVILQDPDGHEICFVGDEGFRDLSRPDPNAQKLLDAAIAADSSQAWLEKRAKQEAEMAAKGV